MQDFHPVETKRCYACIQWQGARTYEPQKKMIRVDAGRMGNCLMKRTLVRGSAACDQFFPLH